MWKKIGAIGSSPNDNKSSRSKDQNAYQPFSQMSKIRVSQSQLFFDNNQLFCPSYLGKKKGTQNKCFTQSKILSQQIIQVKSAKQIPNQNSKLSTIKKKTLDRQQSDELKLRISQKIIEGMDDSLDKQEKQCDQQPLPDTQSTQVLCSQTSIDDGLIKLKHVKSTPQFNFNQIGSISEEVSFDRKIQTQKNINSLKKQHQQIKKSLKHELTDFKKSFKSVETQIKNQISKIMQNSINTKNQQNIAFGKNKSLNFDQVANQTKKFGDKFKHLNQKKVDMMNKLISLREK